MNRMYVILFIAFFLFSCFFILLISWIYNIYWDGLFSQYHQQIVKSHAYKLVDDMREKNILQGPLSKDDVLWLNRRTRLYGVLVQFSKENGGPVWYDTITTSGSSLAVVEEVPYIVEGSKIGQLRVAYLEASTELNPAMVSFRESLKVRSRYLFGIIIVLSVLISFWLSYILTKRLKWLDQYAQDIRQGKWVSDIPLKGPDEIRRLALTLSGVSAELQKQEEWRKNLMEDMAHELRTPLTSLMVKMEAMIDGIYQADAEQLDKMYLELERLSRLVTDLQCLSEAEGAQFGLNLKQNDIVKLANQVYLNYRPLATNAGIRMLFDPANTPTYAEVDYDKLYQVVSNIVSNAIKYTPQGGEVELKIHATSSHTIISCKDNGIGIGQEDLPYIFNRLYRADKSRSRFTGGVGLGLSIAKALVQAHDGTIEVQSVERQGSLFTVYIPNQYRS